MQTLRWGLLSTALINRHLIPAIRSAPRCELRAVASRDAAKAKAYAAEWEIPRAFGSYDALLADPNVDVIYISAPNHLHAEWAIKAANAGKHVLVEKPIALSVDEVDRMMEAARRNRIVVAEAFSYVHHPQTIAIRELIAQGAIGEVRLIDAAYSYVHTRENDYRLRPEFGGGALWDIGCYAVSFIRLAANAPPLEVIGRQVAGPSGIDMSFAGLLRFESGALGRFDCSFQAAFRTRAEVVGSEALLRIDDPFRSENAARFSLIRNGGHEQIVRVSDQMRYLGEVEDFCAVVLDGKPPRFSLQESRALVQTLVALYASANNRQPVTLHA
jgi:predicted dehydrogenase